MVDEASVVSTSSVARLAILRMNTLQTCLPFVLECLSHHSDHFASKGQTPPYFLGLNGVQGVGKTTLVSWLGHFSCIKRLVESCGRIPQREFLTRFSEWKGIIFAVAEYI